MKSHISRNLLSIFVLVLLLINNYIFYTIGRTSVKHEVMTLLIMEENVTTDPISIEDLKQDIITLR